MPRRCLPPIAPQMEYTRSMERKCVLAFVCLLVCPQMSAMDKEELLSKYHRRFFVVLQDGLPACFSGLEQAASKLTRGVVAIDGVPRVAIVVGCSMLPLQKGEIVFEFKKPAFLGGHLSIQIEAHTPRTMTVGIGAFAHEILGYGKTEVIFWSAKDDFDKADALAAQWLKPYDTIEDARANAAQIGNTASGVVVHEVKAGMTFAEVESALGLPVTKIGLGEKTLYKYKDMTVEFHDGKVTDVR